MNAPRERFVDIVITHGECPDGTASAWIINLKLVKQGFDPKNVVFMEYRHGQNVFDEYGNILYTKNGEKQSINYKDKRIIMIDVCYSRDDMLTIKRNAESFICLDHHESAEKELKGLDYCIFDMNKSGCQLAWDYCFRDIEPPWFIKLIADRDLWKWIYPETKPFHAAMANRGYTIENLYELYNPGNNSLYSDHKQELLDEGAAIVKVEDKEIKDAYEWAQRCTLTTPITKTKYTVFLAHTSKWNLVSELGNVLAARNDCDFSVVWTYNVKDDKWGLSLRGIESKGFSMSSVAEEFIYRGKPGGGHANASGCAIDGTTDDHLKNYFTNFQKRDKN